jgi:DNA-binding winged helix-turn-helix (wHTH) protein/TolB-like protein
LFQCEGDVVSSSRQPRHCIQGPHVSQFRFGAFEVDVARGEIRKHGLRVKLHEKSFSLLALLLERPGEIVSHDEIRRRLWSADVFVDFDRNLYTTLNRLRQALGDSPDRPQYVETVHRRGYRFLAPVERLEPPAQSAGEAAPSKRSRLNAVAVRHKVGLRIAAALAAATVLAVSLYLWSDQLNSPLAASRTSITVGVLLFENLTGNPAEDYRSCGLTQEILVELARSLPAGVSVKVWPPGGHFATSTPQLTGNEAELVADYLLEGGVHRENGRIRVTVELVDVGTGKLIWAKRLIRDSGDLASSQEQMAQEIVEELSAELTNLTGPRMRNIRRND